MSKIIATVLCRLDSWSLPLALRSALEWCDEVVVGIHEPGGKAVDPCWGVIASLTKSTDVAKRIDVVALGNEAWDEMEMRQRLLERARELGATHVAIVDADEAVTADLCGDPIRKAVLALSPGNALDVPMVSPHHGGSQIGSCLHKARTDGVFSRAKITLAFADAPNLAWKNAADGYCYHNRPPRGIQNRIELACEPMSGVFHLQYADLRRLACKAAYYKITERLKFPDREESSPAALNKKYDWTLEDDGETYAEIPPGRWLYPFGAGTDFVDLHEVPWQAWAVVVLVERHKGTSVLDGLVLHEWSWEMLGNDPRPSYASTF